MRAGHGGTGVFKIFCAVLIIIGLAWVYTGLYGGPMQGMFDALDRMVPQIRMGVHLGPV